MALDGATILQVIPDLDAGGAERTTIEVAAALTAAGAHALVASRGGRMEDDLAAAGGELVRLERAGSKSPLTIWMNANKLAAVIRQRRVALIHARSRAPAWSALWAARRTGRPFVTTYHGAYSARTAPKRLYNSVMARGAAVIANSAFTADLIRREHPFAADRIVTIPRGVDVAAFDPARVDEARTAALRKDWRIPDGETLILLPARLTAWKGHRVAIDAAAALAREGRTGWRMVFAGDPQGRDGYVADLQSRIMAQGLDERVRIVGHCSDMPAALKLSDIVLAPSTEAEAFGRVAAEAGAIGRPVAASNLGGQREVVVDGETGVLTPPGDAEAVAKSLRALIEMGPGGRAALGDAAQRRVRALYTTRALQTATLDVYRRLIGDRAPERTS
ncbi:glycosyltransferase [bacterium]|nr:glycosyltransferase [bacterium]